jgi:hypothetical protein
MLLAGALHKGTHEGCPYDALFAALPRCATPRK